MYIELPSSHYDRFARLLSVHEDAFQMAENEYTLDLFDMEHPMALELVLAKGTVEILAAVTLLFDVSMNGWYVGERIEDEVTVNQALTAWIEGQPSDGD